MLIKMDDFFTSGWAFDENQEDVKSRYQMTNIALLLSGFGFIYGITVNTIYDAPDIRAIEAVLLFINIVLFFVLRNYRNQFELVIKIITAQCTFLMLYIVYTSEIDSMKHVWIFTYPIVLLYFQKHNNGLYWSAFFMIMILIGPIQQIFEVQYSIFQAIYLGTVLTVVSTIVYFYQTKMRDANGLISQQQVTLKKQIDELLQKDRLLSAQSKQAVMGEMISMIAHQWRQPLSTVTLSVSNLQVRKLLGEKIEDNEFDKALEDISDTVVYLSNTIDDFQTYFNPNKILSDIEVHQLIDKVINFVVPRLKSTKIYIEVDKSNDREIYIQTYMNELIQVILNIVNNSIDALILSHIKNPKIILSVKEKTDTIVITVQDNAGGIKEEDITRIFEPYFSTKGKNGTGLGLYMSQMIIQKQFDGKIDVSSSDKGSFFSVEIQKILS